MVRGFVNAKVYASFKPVKVFEGFVVADGRVVKVGRTEEVKSASLQMGGDVLDLNGRVVMPGFVDSHLHMEELGMYLSMAELRGTKSISELKERVKAHLETSQTSWVLGHGWDQELFKEKRWPTNRDIDEVVKDRPVMLSRVCLHAAVLNSKALEVTGLAASDLPGVERAGGKPTGIVKEKAFEVARERFKASLSPEDYEHFLTAADRHLLLLGVTSVGSVSMDEKTLKALSNLNRSGKLKTKVFAYIDPGRHNPAGKQMYEDTGTLACLERLSVSAGYGKGRLRIQGIKILGDGSLGARTAWLSIPYADSPKEIGYPNISEELLEEVVRRAHEIGIQMSVHGIGDATIDMILHTYEALKNPATMRHRIEHTSILREDQIVKMAEVGIAAGVQPHFIITDWWTVNRVGKKRAKWIYPFRSMARAGIQMGFGTDSPVEPVNPWETVYAAVTRGRYEGIKTYEHTQEESLTTEESLHYYTQGSAEIMHAERDVGEIKEGAYADFLILNRDPLQTAESELQSVKVVERFVEGEAVQLAFEKAKPF